MSAAGQKLGDAYIQVTADASKTGEELSAKVSKDLEKAARRVGETFDESLSQAVEDSTEDLGDVLGEQLDKGSKRAGGRFAETLQKELGKALQNLPEVEVTADSSEADRALDEVRRRVTALRDQRIGIDVTAEAADRELTQLQERLTELGAGTTDLSFRADTSAASADLARLQEEVRRLNGETAEVTVKADGSSLDNVAGQAGRASGGLSLVSSLAMAVSPALIPIGAAALVGLGSIAPLAASAGAGLAVLGLGFAGVSNTVKLLGQRQDTLATQAATSAGKQVSSAGAIKSAQDSLANTQQNAADSAVKAAETVTNAQAALAKAVTDGQRAVADATAKAAADLQTALGREHTAEESLSAALRTQLQAQRDLTAARKSAKEQLEDLANSVIDNGYAQEQALADVTDAQKQLNAVLRNPRSSEAARKAAQLNYDSQLQRQKELELQGQRLAAQQADATAKGVDGSDQVVAAQQGVQDANQRAADAQQTAADAAAAVDKARVDGAQAVADAETSSADKVAKAQQAVSDALRDQASQARQSAFSIQQAQAAVAAAMTSAGAAGGSALAGIDTQLAKVDPATRKFSDYVVNTLQPAWEGIKATAAAGLLPGVQSGLEKLQPLLPVITSFVSSMSTTLGGIFDDLGTQLSSPFWTNFFQQLQTVAGPALEDMYDAGMDVVTAVAAIIQAFLPFTGDVGGGITDVTQKFKDWALQVGDSPGFHSFIDYVKENWPKIQKILGDLIDLVSNLISGEAEQGSGTLDVIQKITDALASLSPGALQAVVAAFAGFSVAKAAAGQVGDLVQQGKDAKDTYDTVKDAFNKAQDVYAKAPGQLSKLASAIKTNGAVTKVWAGAQRVLNAVMNMSPLGIVLTIIGLLVAAFITAYTTSDTFRGIVQGVLSAVVDAFKAAWSWLEGAFSWLMGVLTSIGSFFADVWGGIQDAVVAVVSFIAGAITAYFNLYWTIVSTVLSTILGVVTSVWNGISSAISAVLGFIGGLISSVWNGIVGSVQWALGALSSAISSVWGGIRSTISNVLGGIASFIAGVWQGIVSTAGSVLGGIAGVVTGAFSGISGIVKDAINLVIRGINNTALKGINLVIDGLNVVPGVDIPHVPQIPLLANGALVDRATLAVLGEAGPEAVIPLSPGKARQRQALMAEAGLSGDGGAAGGQPIQVDARQYYEVKDTQTAQEVGAVMGQRLVRDLRNGVTSRHTGAAA